METGKGLALAYKKVAFFDGGTLDTLNTGMKLFGVLSGVGAMSSFGLKRVIERIQNNPRRRALLEDLMTNDPIIKTADRAQVVEFYATIFSIAPTISLDKNVVRELLQSFVKFGRVDIQTVKTLAELEGRIKDNKVPSAAPRLKDFLITSDVFKPKGQVPAQGKRISWGGNGL